MLGFCGETGALATVRVFCLLKPVGTVRVWEEPELELDRECGTSAYSTAAVTPMICIHC